MSFWSSGRHNGCAGITETRQTALFRTTCERGYEVVRGRKARQIAPKTRNLAFLGNTTGSKKPTTKIMKKVLLEHQWLMARGRTPPNKQSFRGCPNVISFCLLMGCKGPFDGACGHLPVSRRVGKTRQIAFVGGIQIQHWMVDLQGSLLFETGDRQNNWSGILSNRLRRFLLLDRFRCDWFRLFDGFRFCREVCCCGLRLNR